MTPRDGTTPPQTEAPQAPDMQQAAADAPVHEMHPRFEGVRDFGVAVGHVVLVGAGVVAAYEIVSKFADLAQRGYNAVQPALQHIGPEKMLIGGIVLLGGTALACYAQWRKDNPKPELPTSEPAEK